MEFDITHSIITDKLIDYLIELTKSDDITWNSFKEDEYGVMYKSIYECKKIFVYNFKDSSYIAEKELFEIFYWYNIVYDGCLRAEFNESKCKELFDSIAKRF